MDNTLIRAVGKLRFETVSAEGQIALNQLIACALRQRQALKFYANPHNYIDGAPHLQQTDTQLAPLPDDGSVARYALGEDQLRHVN